MDCARHPIPNSRVRLVPNVIFPATASQLHRNRATAIRLAPQQFEQIVDHCGPRRGVLFVFGVALALVLGNAASSPTIAGESAKAACETAAAEAVRISQETNPPPAAHILNIRTVSVVSDTRKTYVPPVGASEAILLTCTGEASWSDTSVGKVLLTETIDAEGTIFVKYQPIP